MATLWCGYTLVHCVCVLFQVRIKAEDTGLGNARRSAEALLFVTIRRNFLQPSFSSQELFKQISIPENQASGVVFLSITATDGDQQEPNNVVRYRFAGNVDPNDSRYFQINDNGGISVKGDLRDDPFDETRYTVCT